MARSQIVSFFDDSVVLLTGATGFLGKLFLDRLLRVCGVRIIYVLMRSKKGVSDADRFAQLFEKPVFDRLKAEVPDFRKLVVLIKGDCAMPNLGVSDHDWTRLLCDVHVVIHCAATVRFDQTLRLAYNINVRATRDLLDKCTQMNELKSIIYISTAYTNCMLKVIGEKVYKSPITEDQLNLVLQTFTNNEETIVRITPALLGTWPNTYTLTKCVTEDMVQQLAVKHDLPLSIVRPSMVISTYKEPMPGWIDNFYGPIGVTFGGGVGIIRSMPCVPEYHADLVPADFVISAVLAAAWHTANGRTPGVPRSEVMVYNYTADELALEWKTYSEKTNHYGKTLQSMYTIWPVMFCLNRYEIVHRVYCFLFHTVPAHIIDFVADLIGKPRQMVQLYKRTHRFIDAIKFFTLHEWRFDTANVRHLWTQLNPADQALFEFRMSTLDWDTYIPDFLKGGRVYLFNDPLSTLPAAQRRYRKMVIADWTLKILLLVALFAFLYFLFI